MGGPCGPPIGTGDDGVVVGVREWSSSAVRAHHDRYGDQEQCSEACDDADGGPLSAAAAICDPVEARGRLAG
jgi:hypothetical protein